MNWTPAQIFAALVGVVLLAGGIVGLVTVNDDFGTDSLTRDEFLIFDVNGWNNLLHLVAGAIGVLVAVSARGAKLFALGIGTIYFVLAVYGILDESPADLFVANDADNLLHLGIGILLFDAGLLSGPGKRLKVVPR